MNSKLLLLSFIMLLTMVTNHAQTSAEQAGIAVQGIARDANNTAITTGEPINFKFSIYYKDGQDYNVHEESVSLETDSFGVFSHVIDVDYEKNSAFSHNQLYLKIEAGSPLTVISDEQLKHVPYAVSANNGVPMGSIMPFLGDSAPAGWVLCKGQTWTSVGAKGDRLKAFLGNPSSVPNLGGMFLRGTGGAGNHVGPALNEVQDDAYEKHLHNASHNHVLNDPGHAHNMSNLVGHSDEGESKLRRDGGLGADSDVTSFIQPSATNITIDQYNGNTQNSGTILETRPINYGVNYIIKL